MYVVVASFFFFWSLLSNVFFFVLKSCAGDILVAMDVCIFAVWISFVFFFLRIEVFVCWGLRFFFFFFDVAVVHSFSFFLIFFIFFWFKSWVLHGLIIYFLLLCFLGVFCIYVHICRYWMIERCVCVAFVVVWLRTVDVECYSCIFFFFCYYYYYVNHSPSLSNVVTIRVASVVFSLKWEGN